MKRFLFFGLVMLCCFVFISCSQNVSLAEDEHLIVISNVDSISNEASKAFGEGAPIEGVLLKYNHEGLYGVSVFDLSNPNAFYLEELEDTESTWYGMKFNYVLYVPDCIQRVYKSGLGVNPNSGNPFWWYVSTYYDMNLSQIENDWNKAFSFLLENKDYLANPVATDVGLKRRASKYNYAKGLKVKEKWDNVFSVDVTESSEGTETTITIPSIIMFEYRSGFGHGGIKDAFYWYLETYFRKTSNEINEMYEKGTLKDWISSLELCPPHAEDVSDYGIKKVSSEVYIESDLYSLLDVYCYIPDRVTDIKGSPVDESRCYISLEDYEGRTGFRLYVPRSYINEYEEEFGTSNGSGNLVWNALESRWGSEALSSIENDSSIEKRYLEDLLSYRSGVNFWFFTFSSGMSL